MSSIFLRAYVYLRTNKCFYRIPGKYDEESEVGRDSGDSFDDCRNDRLPAD